MRLRHALASLAALGGLVFAGCDAAGPAPAAGAAAPAAAQATAQPVADQYLVVFDNGVADAPGLARRLARAQGAAVLHTYEHAVKGFAFRGSARAAAALERNPNVVRVEPDQVVTKVTTTQQGATWGLDRSDARSGLDGSYSYNATGAGVTAYVLDTGIRTSHADFGGRASVGFDAIGDGQNGQDCDGHGTHVAGTVGGAEYGVAKGVDLVAVRVLDCNGSGTISGVVAGVDWVTGDASGPSVANMSLGGGTSSTLDDAVANSIAAGVSYAIAAGNGDRRGRQVDACQQSPARVPEAITISATNSSDTKASWANYGSCVDFFAPGVSITSAWYTGDSATATISGTSMAAPHVAGAAALFLETNAGASPQAVRDALYNATTKNVVQNSSTANNHLLYTLDFTGGGDGGGGDTNAPPTADFSVSTSDLTASFSDGSSDADGTVASWDWDFGDGSGSTAQNPSHTYGAAGTYTVTLSVTDDDGATDSATQTVTVSSGSTGGLSLSVDGYKVRGRWNADLSWSGASSASVDVYRDGGLITTTANDGAFSDATNNRGSGTLTYRVCEAGTSTCSNDATASF